LRQGKVKAPTRRKIGVKKRHMKMEIMPGILTEQKKEGGKTTWGMERVHASVRRVREEITGKVDPDWFTNERGGNAARRFVTTEGERKRRRKNLFLKPKVQEDLHPLLRTIGFSDF